MISGREEEGGDEEEREGTKGKGSSPANLLSMLQISHCVYSRLEGSRKDDKKNRTREES